jgi:hypothetical protein
MRSSPGIRALYQAPVGPNGTNPNVLIDGHGIGFRINPAPVPGQAGAPLFTFPRTILFQNANKSNYRVTHNGWIRMEFDALGFGIEYTGANAVDYWDLEIAEVEGDFAAGPGNPFWSGMVFDTTTNLWTTPNNPILTGSTVTIKGQTNVASNLTDQQFVLAVGASVVTPTGGAGSLFLAKVTNLKASTGAAMVGLNGLTATEIQPQQTVDFPIGPGAILRASVPTLAATIDVVGFWAT